MITALAIATGILAILIYAWLSAALHREQRAHAATFALADDAVAAAQRAQATAQHAIARAAELALEYRLLEARNDALEQERRYARHAIGGTMLHIPERVARLVKAEDRRMVIRQEGGNAP